MGSSDVGDLEGLIFAPVPPVSQIAAAIPSCRLRRRPPQGRCGGARRARHQRRPAAVSFAPSARARLGRQWARRHPSRIQLRRCPSCRGAPWLKRIERSNSAKKRAGYRGLAQTCTAWKLKLKASALRAAVPWPKETKDKKGARRRLVASGGPRAEAIPAMPPRASGQGAAAFAVIASSVSDKNVRRPASREAYCYACMHNCPRSAIPSTCVALSECPTQEWENATPAQLCS